MTWFKVDDGFWSHPKTATLSDAAVTLWVRAGAYSCQHLTDGVIARPVLRLVGTDAAAGELVDAGLWRDHPDGWEFHDWGDYQETRDAVRKRRDEWRDRQKRSRDKSAQKHRESQDESRVTHGESHGVSQGVPSRPVPSTTSNEVVALSPDESDDNGSLIPGEWRPNQKHVDKAASLRLDVKAEYQRFRSHAERTHRRLKNWNAGFTNWLRKTAEMNQQRNGAPERRTFGQQKQDNTLALIAELREEETRGQVAGGNAAGVRALDSGR